MNKPTLRRSQLITTFGPGAIVNLINGSYMGMSIDQWPTEYEDRVYDDRLQKKLGKKFFVQPPSQDTNKTGLPYIRFPRWFFCPHPKCRRLQPYEKWNERSPRQNNYQLFVCPDHRAPLVPMNFLVVCSAGHIDDFPWSEWVHRAQPTCAADLRYEKGSSGAGLGGIVIRCVTCKASRPMTGSFSPEVFKDKQCTAYCPWLNKTATTPCSRRMFTVQRGGSNVYFPRIVSSIAIPSPFNNLIEDIKRTEGWKALSSLAMTASSVLTPETKKIIIDSIAKEVNRSASEVTDFIGRAENVDSDQAITDDESYLHDEYLAFHGNYDKSVGTSRDFRVEDATSGFEYSAFGIKTVVMVKAIREVRALLGFTRLRPLDNDEDPETGASVEKPILVSVSENDKNWLPAMEVRGEGIFVAFDETRLEEWAERDAVKERMRLMNMHHGHSCARRGKQYEPLSAKKVLLHTLAHLLIRQLSFECGYTSASLRERIYCDAHGHHKMQGILIYTAAGDADGTLGGLVRQAKSDRFPQTLSAALKNTEWCSNDPLCSESKGQGFESLNLAACYACALLPETSCETFNKFLDRALVVGLPDDQSAAFFSTRIGV